MANNKDYEKKISWSKGVLLCTSLMFIFVVLFVLYLYTSNNVENNMYDVTLLATVVTITGGIFGSNLVWYSKKAASENQYKLRMNMYEESARVRLDYNEKMIILSQKYNMDKSEIEQIDYEGHMDDFMNTALSDVQSGLDYAKEDSETPNQIEQFNI